MTAICLNAQTLLDEDFETASTETYSTPIANGSGWTTVDSYTGTTASYNWTNYYSQKGTIGGKHVACCSGPTYESSASEGFGPREEILLTPDLALDNTYQLSFDWKVSPMNAYAASLYGLEIRIVENDDVTNAETIFSTQSEEDLKASGVMVWPISTWDPHTSKIDLSEWQGKTIKIAFVYKMYTTISNILYLDNVSVKKFTPDTAPVPVLSSDRYNFGNVYIGEKFYTEVITLTNNGLNGLQITGVDMPQGVAINFDYSTVNLNKYESCQFQFSYTATLTSPATGTVVIHTNGGDLNFSLSATKQVVPEGYTLETFETYFPPAGWTNDGWSATSTALEGDRSVYAGGSLTNNYLTTPRLDLTNGGNLTFTYYNYFISEEGGTYQNNDISVEVSYDGGETWTQKWIFDYTKETFGETLTINLGTGTNNSYVRWKNSAIGYGDNGAEEFSFFYFDRVLLPKVYGQNGVPYAATLVAPADSATEVYYKNIELKWGPAQFAMGYRVYVGTTEEANDLVNGMDVMDALSYTIPQAEYETFYYWKIVPYNTYGNAQNVPVWHFTTQKDASVAAFPYAEDFSDNKLPTGWTTTPSATYNREWKTNSIYGNTAPCLYVSWLNTNELSAVTTQEFTLPSDKRMAISFDWGDSHPSNLVAASTGIITKNNINPNNGYSEVVFEITTDGGYTWTQLSSLSENYFDGDNKYWIPETIDLSAYAGQTVQFRWTHYSYNSNLDKGASLDNVVIEEVLGDKAVFNMTGWNAGKVNYEKAVNSGIIFTIINKGTNKLKVANTTFESPNFTTDLAVGTEIEPLSGKQFSIQFNALTTSATVDDALTITFESGYSISLPVSGEALAEDVLYYAFEPNNLEHQWTSDFTLIDVDNAATWSSGAYWLNFDQMGQKFAFAPANDDEMYGVMQPVSGKWALVGAGCMSRTADDWIVSKQLTATTSSTFEFYARNWECNQSTLPAKQHKIEVLVSETSATDRNTFTTILASQEIPFLDWHDWKLYTVDLSSYAGKNIYIALRHTTQDEESNWSFYDDFMFSHFTQVANHISTIGVEISANAEVVVYNINGVMVKSGIGINVLQSLDRGLYIVKVKDGDNVKTLRIARK